MNILLPICSLQSHFAFDYSYRKGALEIINVVVVVISFFPCKKKLKGMNARSSIDSTGTSFRVRGDFKGRSGDDERKGGSSSPSAVSNLFASPFSCLILRLMFPYHRFFIYNPHKVNNK